MNVNLMNEDTWFVVVNPMAGSNGAGRVWAEISGEMDRLGICYETYMVTAETFARDRVVKAVAEGFRRFVAVGGDGTVHQVLTGMRMCPHGTPVLTLAVIPAGSGNDWVRLWGIPRNFHDAVSLLVNGRSVPQDVGRVCLEGGDGTSMMNVAGAGLDAYVCNTVNAMKSEGKRGKMLYIKALVKAYLRYRSLHARIVCDGHVVHEGPLLSVSVGNGRFSGGGMKQTPLARPDDGLFDVTVIKAMSFWKILGKVRKLFDGTIAGDPCVVSCRCRCVNIECTPSSLVEVDGEICGCTPAAFEVEPLAVNVVVPQEAASI